MLELVRAVGRGAVCQWDEAGTGTVAAMAMAMIMVMVMIMIMTMVMIMEKDGLMGADGRCRPRLR